MEEVLEASAEAIDAPCHQHAETSAHGVLEHLVEPVTKHLADTPRDSKCRLLSSNPV